jgi:hypothetical protein
MAFPGAFGTSLATILGGQEQTAAQSQAYAEQIRQRQQEEAINHALLVRKLADLQTQDAAIAQLPPKYRKIIDAGGTMSDVIKAQAQGDAGTVAANLYGANPADRPKILSEALRNNPDIASELPEFQRIPGVAAVRPERETDAEWFRRDPKGYAAFKAAGRKPESEDSETETPIPLTDVTTVNGKNGYWARSRGNPVPRFIEMPGASPKAAARKPLTPTALNAVNKQIANDWALQPTKLSDAFSGDRKRAFFTQRKKVILFGMGYDESGQPFRDGEQVKDPSNGKVLTWRNE